MKPNKHLQWTGDDRVCQLPDPKENEVCPGCCVAVSPRTYVGTNWECIWKAGHEGNHCDFWLIEWNDDGIVNVPKYAGRCYYCGEHVPFDGMTYCGKACSALGSIK